MQNKNNDDRKKVTLSRLRSPILGQWFSTLRLIRKRKLSLAGAIIVVSFIGLSIAEAVLGNAILPYSPYARSTPKLPPSIFFANPPSLAHIFGTDALGHDVFSQIIAALPLDAEVAFLVIVSAVTIGMALGVMAGYIGGKTNQIIMRVTDIFIAFPGIILALAIAASLGPGLVHGEEALIVIWWPTYTRLARGEVLVVKGQLYVEAARASGLSSWKIMLRHVAPNIVSPIIVYGTLDIGNVILQTSVLSYLGLGAQPPTPELGRMVFENQPYLLAQPWLSLAPGVVILIVVLGFNLLGDGLRDVLDPRLQRIISLPSTSAERREDEPVVISEVMERETELEQKAGPGTGGGD